MSMFRTTSRLSKPRGRERIPSGAFAYLRARNKMRMFSMVHNELSKAGLSQAELAARMGKGTDRICKLLGAPGNWTADTFSDLLFAIKGGIPEYRVTYPLDAPKRNDNQPHWLPAYRSSEGITQDTHTGTDARYIHELRPA
jgi:hypothetical protein